MVATGRDPPVRGNSLLERGRAPHLPDGYNDTRNRPAEQGGFAQYNALTARGSALPAVTPAGLGSQVSCRRANAHLANGGHARGTANGTPFSSASSGILGKAILRPNGGSGRACRDRRRERCRRANGCATVAIPAQRQRARCALSQYGRDKRGHWKRAARPESAPRQLGYSHERATEAATCITIVSPR